MDLLQFDWSLVIDYGIKLVVTFLLALPIAWDREHHTRIMGLRTFPLVAVASCAYLLVADSFIPDDGHYDAQARVMQGLIGGIGFVGAGAILKNDDRVVGTASAASIWNLGAMGASVAYGNLEIALLLVVFNLIVLRVLGDWKIKINGEDDA